MHITLDLGTSHSRVAAIGPSGTPTLFPDKYDLQSFATPSIIAVSPDGVIVGRCLDNVRRVAGDIPAARFRKAAMGALEPILVDACGRGWLAPAVAAIIVRKLVEDVRRQVPDDAFSAAVTVPTAAPLAVQDAYRQALWLAGISDVDLIAESQAIAMHYRADRASAGTTFLTYSLGADTFETTVLRAEEGKLSVLACESATGLGGMLIDAHVANHLKGQYVVARNTSSIEQGEQWSLLERHAEMLKQKLSAEDTNDVRTCLSIGEWPQEVILTRRQLARCAAATIDATLEIVGRVLKAAHLTWKEVHSLLLAGGSVCVPGVSAALQAASGMSSDAILCRQPECAAVSGAALLSRHRSTLIPGSRAAWGQLVDRAQRDFITGIRILT